ncbi:hypothetical protein [Sphingomonas sp.]|uniref:hypothetical protein n=1 Tax=Sphingomonas sp. TaxID=28214 RepID=UPI0031D066AB
MIRRETDAELVNRIANHPSVWPHVARHGQPLDFSAAFPATQSGAVVLTNGEDAAMVFEQTADRVWQVCTMFQDTCRKERAREVGAAMRDYMAPYADLIFGKVPNSLPHAKRFYADLGAVPVPVVKVDGEDLQAIQVGDDWYVSEPGEELFALRMAH